jgi:allantoin racemase
VCSEIRACEVPVLALEDPASDARRLVIEECHAVIANGADAVVLGCAGMADFCAEVSAQIGAPVVDGVSAATVLAESLVRLGLRTGHHGEFARPPAKRITGLLADFEISPNTTDTSAKHGGGRVLA